MDNKQILQIAMKQSAIDSNCSWRDFMEKENKVVISERNENARKYLELPFICDLTSYGNNIVASVSEPMLEIVTEYTNKFPVVHCFETPNLHQLMSCIRPMGYDVCFMAEYSLPNVDVLLGAGLAVELQRICPYEIRLMGSEEFQDLYMEQWSNALCKNRKNLDVIGVGAYDGNRLIGLAGASADCDSMWQIGIDVLPEYRRRGIAATLTSKLGVEILNLGIVPFYCCAWSNVGSIRNAIASGFRPAWVQITVKELEKIAKMNQ